MKPSERIKELIEEDSRTISPIFPGQHSLWSKIEAILIYLDEQYELSKEGK